jgi:hypothetical protein|nr:MAG TPA: hypothetical protein [Caudoviricetes sp.]
MVYFTIISKSVTCPLWKVPVTLSCKYRLPNDEHSTEPAIRQFVTCPIKESTGHPKRELDYMICRSDFLSCLYLANKFTPFPEKLEYPYYC